jgi:hypothetical protein
MNIFEDRHLDYTVRYSTRALFTRIELYLAPVVMLKIDD